MTLAIRRLPGLRGGPDRRRSVARVHALEIDQLHVRALHAVRDELRCKIGPEEEADLQSDLPATGALNRCLLPQFVQILDVGHDGAIPALDIGID
jgi:hypothetical protein